MLQLANILHTQGFEITIIHTEYNSPNHSNYPHFIFKSIRDRFFEIEHQLTKEDASFFVIYLNRSCEESFRDCLTRLLAEDDEGSISCLISYALFYFTQAVADSLNLPRLALRTTSLASAIAYGALPFASEIGCFNLTKGQFLFRRILNITSEPTFPYSNYEAPVPEFPLMKMKASSGIIWNTFKELEQPSLETIRQEFSVPSFTLGPFHKYFPASSSSLIEQDRTVLSWLDTQAPKSVIYSGLERFLYDVLTTMIARDAIRNATKHLTPPQMEVSRSRSFLTNLDSSYYLHGLYMTLENGILVYDALEAARITESAFQELAHGLTNTGLPFLWVIRLGLIPGRSKWLECLPEKFLERLGDGGRIVKWAPQEDVLAHPATGCFWTHCGWNSTLESIYEGVPMVCSPCFVDQPVNARYVSDVWKIGVLLEDGFDRVGIERAIKRVMMEKEGEEIRERITTLKEKLNLSLEEGGSSHQSLKGLVDYILSF
ncbi:unnamed protein product [Lactuca saligna]|uniref:Glycosyltransferase n=1 Tax=Lactuca saligna TaxID=75948 RepID=A0AA36DVM0_LACSI|nr:unnamed protein product [Lactuca saligna]